MNLRLPNIDAADDHRQLQQIRSYLYQISGELNWALEHLQQAPPAGAVTSMPATAAQKGRQTQATFSELKSLIIKSADIVNAYYEEINKKLVGQYVAVSDFGTYQQDTSATLKANSDSVNLLFDNQQTLTTNVTGLQTNLSDVSGTVDGINAVVERGENYTTILGSEAWCKIGVLGYEESGFPIYGMEIGQVNSENGQQVMKKFAQYRSDGVHLFDQNGTEVATISDRTLRITNAEINNANITGSLKLGGYTARTDNGLVIKWAGERP